MRLAFRRLVESRAAERAAAARRRQPGRRRVGERGAVAGRDVRAGRGRRLVRVRRRVVGRGHGFRVRHREAALGVFRIAMAGAHNVKNALAAMAIATAVGVDADTMRDGARGVRRREAPARKRGVGARRHRPGRFRASPDGRAGDAGGREGVASRPRGSGPSSSRGRRRRAGACSRTRSPLPSRAADEVVIAQVYRAQLPADERLSPERLVADLRRPGGTPVTCPDVDGIVELLASEVARRRHRRGDVKRRLRRHSREAARRASLLDDGLRQRDRLLVSHRLEQVEDRAARVASHPERPQVGFASGRARGRCAASA